MIKVELMYKITMNGTDWLMSEEEYKEFRNTAIKLPIFFKAPSAAPESLNRTNGLSNLKAMIADQYAKSIEESLLKGITEINRTKPLTPITFSK